MTGPHRAATARIVRTRPFERYYVAVVVRYPEADHECRHRHATIEQARTCAERWLRKVMLVNQNRGRVTA